jgi:predicted RND superfamily exporter protein
MLTLVNLLIIFFIILIFYQIFLAYFGNSIMEGYENKDNKDNKEYQSYDTNNPDNALILAQQNAGNIIVLKGQMDEMLGINKQVQDLSGNVANLEQQVTDLVQAQKDYANQLTGGTEPEISGTTEEGEITESSSNYMEEEV